MHKEEYYLPFILSRLDLWISLKEERDKFLNLLLPDLNWVPQTQTFQNSIVNMWPLFEKAFFHTCLLI